MIERSELIEWMRSELVGPSRPLSEPAVIQFVDRQFADPVALRRGALAWRPNDETPLQEVLFYERESPYRKYGAGLLHPIATPLSVSSDEETASQATDAFGAEPGLFDPSDDADSDRGIDVEDRDEESADADSDDFDVTSIDIRHPSTLGVSFCTRLSETGQVEIRLPDSRHFFWQPENASPFPVNGR